MKIPLSWLSEYVDLENATAEAVAETLTGCGVEVEGLDPVGHRYDDLVVADVRAVSPHPNADRLRLCRVFDGRGELDIVCGAHNFEAGARAAFAPVGARLADGSRLRRARIRGEWSNGMLCAEDELGLSDDHDGILLFDPETPAGTPLHQLLPGPDTVLHLEITWNRPDCLSVIGIARELSAVWKRPLHIPAPEPPPRLEASAVVAVPIAVEDDRLCPRYTARLLRHVTDTRAPLWMRRRLTLCGMRPLNAIVDVTNYVMLECGQPLHAFDLDRLAGPRIEVRRARTDERIRTLDGVERTLDPERLVIADAHGPVALAGVMGGEGSQIGPATRAVLIESAVFDPVQVQQTARAFAMRTESAHRFERGVDRETCAWAGRRAAALICALTGARAAPDTADVHAPPPPPREIELRFERARTVIGIPLTPPAMVAHLEALALLPVAIDGETCRIRIPAFRADLETEADLIEEITRIEGLDALPELDPAAPVVSQHDEHGFQRMSRCRRALLGMGFTETLHYSFTSEAILNALDPDKAPARVRLPNPVSADHSTLRDSLLPQLAQTLGNNHARQTDRLAVFEIGRVFGLKGDTPVEETRLGLGLFGAVGRDALDRRRPVKPDEAILWIKGALVRLCAELQVQAPAFVAEDQEAFQPGWGARIELNGNVAGRIGRIHDALQQSLRIQAPVVLAEIALHPLLQTGFERPPLQTPPAYPAIVRDIALRIDPAISHARIQSVIRDAAPSELTSITLFDMFEKKELKDGGRFLAYSLEYRSPSRTMTDEEVNRMHAKVLDALRDKLCAEIRDH